MKVNLEVVIKVKVRSDWILFASLTIFETSFLRNGLTIIKTLSTYDGQLTRWMFRKVTGAASCNNSVNE